VSAAHARPAAATDYPDFARLFPELGVPEPVPPQAEWERDLSKRAVIVERAGRVVAYGLWNVFGELGHVVHVIVDPAHRGQRLGEEVMRALVLQLRARGCTRWMLNVKEENTSAIRLYERMGMRVSSNAQALSARWSVLGQLPMAAGIAVRPLRAEEEGAAEVRFGMPAGALTVRRAASPLHVVFGAFDGQGELLGVAHFAPERPGVTPIRARSIAAAYALLRAAHDLRPSEEKECTLFVEDDQALMAALREAGATLLFGTLQMSGNLPAT
jgi:GNAT superfamily N-acetyltransferase